jgi:hypothetical protein
MKSYKLVLLILAFMIMVAGTGSYYLYKKTQDQVMGYTIELANSILVLSNADVSDDYYLKKIKESVVNSESSKQKQNLDELFNDKNFQREIISNLRSIDFLDGVEDFKSWDLVLADTSKNFPYFWGHLIRIVIIRKEKNLDPYEVDQSHFKYLDSVITQPI